MNTDDSHPVVHYGLRNFAVGKEEKRIRREEE
jgi:hypothetical protein